jgi:hypothetical protein
MSNLELFQAKNANFGEQNRHILCAESQVVTLI